MTKPLTDKEIQKIIDKLRDKYAEYSQKYGEYFFNKKSFEERYLNALRSKINMQAFAYAEVMAFEDLKKKFEQKKEEARIKREKPFLKKIEKIFEELLKRIEKYPSIFSNYGLTTEIEKFCGGLDNFYNEYWLSFSKIIDKDNLVSLKKYNTITDKIQKFIFSTKNRLPAEVENFVLNIRKYNKEKANMIFLKNSALLLKEIKKFLKEINIEDKNKISSNYISINQLSYEKKVEILKSVKEYIDQMIFDFRFKDFISVKV